MISRQNTGEVQAASGDLAGARATFPRGARPGEQGDFFEDMVLTPPAAGPRRDPAGRLARGRRGSSPPPTRRPTPRASRTCANGIMYDRGRLALARGDAADAVRLFSDFPRPDRARRPAHPLHGPSAAGPGLRRRRRPRPRRARADRRRPRPRAAGGPGSMAAGAAPLRLCRHRARRIRSAGPGGERHRGARPRRPGRGGRSPWRSGGGHGRWPTG